MDVIDKSKFLEAQCIKSLRLAVDKGNEFLPQGGTLSVAQAAWAVTQQSLAKPLEEMELNALRKLLKAIQQNALEGNSLIRVEGGVAPRVAKVLIDEGLKVTHSCGHATISWENSSQEQGSIV